MKFKGKNYTEVKDRIEAFLAEFPEATIDNMLVSVNSITDTPTGERCNEYMVRATVYPDKANKPDWFYVGHAAERDNTGFVNKTSALENCETSAAGRALAFAGYGGGYAIASKEEVDNAKQAQKKSHVTVKMLEELDASFKKATPYLDEAMIKRYKEQRTAGHFDTKLRVNATMDYFSQMIKEGKNVTEDKKNAE
jgi:hypothetical protein